MALRWRGHSTHPAGLCNLCSRVGCGLLTCPRRCLHLAAFTPGATSCCRQSLLLGTLRPRGYVTHICSARLTNNVLLVLQACTAKMNLSEEVDLEDYVGRPDKISNAEISAICQEAGMHAVRKNRYAGQWTGGQSSSCQCRLVCVCACSLSEGIGGDHKSSLLAQLSCLARQGRRWHRSPAQLALSCQCRHCMNSCCMTLCLGNPHCS